MCEIENIIHLFTDVIWEQKQSQTLSNASISLSGSGIVIDCEFVEGSPQPSCVLVYREYDSPLLTVADIPQLFYFPVSITVSAPENYTTHSSHKHLCRATLLHMLREGYIPRGLSQQLVASI